MYSIFAFSYTQEPIGRHGFTAMQKRLNRLSALKEGFMFIEKSINT